MVLEDAEPELGSFRFSQPHAQQFLLPVHVDNQGNVNRFIANGAILAGFHKQAIKVDDGVSRIEWPRLPGLNLLQNAVGNIGNWVGETSAPYSSMSSS